MNLVKMKITFILSLVFCFSLDVFSQKISIKERNESIGSGSHSAIVATIYEADASDIEKAWKSLMKDYDAKVTMGGEIFADNAKIKGFDNTCDVYARVKTTSDKEREIIVAVDLGGTYLSSGSHSVQFKKIENIVYDFAVKITKEAFSDRVKEAEKAYKRLVKDQQNLVGEKEQLLKDIENYKNKITQAEQEIQNNEKLQEEKKSEIEKQGKAVEEVKDKLNSVK